MDSTRGPYIVKAPSPDSHPRVKITPEISSRIHAMDDLRNDSSEAVMNQEKDKSNGQVAKYRYFKSGLLAKSFNSKTNDLLQSFLRKLDPNIHKSADVTRRKSRFSFFEGFFDENFYAAAYEDLKLEDLERHFALHGQYEGRWPNALFEADYYDSTHSRVCSRYGNDHQSEVMHFLECEAFTCPSPLLVINPGADSDGSKRGLYLAILYGLINGDDYVVDGFDCEFVGIQLEKNLSSHDFLSLGEFSSIIGAYTFLSASNALFALNGDSNFLLNEKHVNHVLQNASFPRSILSWFLLGDEVLQQHDRTLQLAGEFDILSIAQILDQNLSVNSMVKGVRNFKENQRVSITQTNPKISILVVCLDNARMVLSALGVFLASSAVNDFEILILDNASVDADRDFLRDHVNFARVVRTETRVSFGESNNILAELALGEYLLFLNSDAFVTAAGVDQLAAELDRFPHAVASAPILYFPDGRIQEAGGAWFGDGSVVQFGKGLVSLPKFDQQSLRPYRSASCFMVRCEAFERIGGFNPVFEPAYFEDTFLCAELGLLGEIRTVHSVKVVHLEGFTTSKIEHRENKELAISLNRQKFAERVQGLELIAKASVESRTGTQMELRPQALIVSPYGLMIGGGEQYLLTLSAHLSKTHEVTFAFQQVPTKFRFRRVLWDLGIPEFFANFVEIAEAHSLRPDVMISMGNSLLPNFPPIGKKSVYHCQFPFPDGDSDSRQRLMWAKNYDAVVVNSEFTEQQINIDRHSGVWRNRVYVVNPPVNAGAVAVANGELTDREPSKYRIVSVGRFFEGQHCKNQYEMVQAFGELAAKHDGLELTLLGGVAPSHSSVNYLRKVTRSIGACNVIIRPDASRRSVLTEVRRSNLYWHASGLGVGREEPWRMEHFGIAPVEACQLGVLPLVPDNGGVGPNLRQLDDICVYRDIEELVAKTSAIIEGTIQLMSQEKITDFGHRFSVARFNREWGEILESVED